MLTSVHSLPTCLKHFYQVLVIAVTNAITAVSELFCQKQGLLLLLQDLDHDPSNPNTRLYATHAAQPYHNDASDIVGKLLNMSCRALLTGLGTFVLLTAWL